MYRVPDVPSGEPFAVRCPEHWRLFIAQDRTFGLVTIGNPEAEQVGNPAREGNLQNPLRYATAYANSLHPFRLRLSVAVKKGAILAPLAPKLSAAFWKEPFSPPRRCCSEQPGAVKGAPLLGAAKRTLDGEDCSARLEEERKARRRIGERWSQKVAPSPGATDTEASDGGCRHPRQASRCKL